MPGRSIRRTTGWLQHNFLSTAGRIFKDVPTELVKFLRFIASDLEGSKANFEDPYVEQLQNSVNKIKSDREMGERYMIFLRKC